MTWRRALPWIAAFALLAGVGQRVIGGGDSAGAPDDATARVIRIVDGDTIKVRVGGRAERLRYIGIDTPETKKPDTPVQCYGHEASDRNAKLVDGEQVRLRFDVERRDRFGRLLAYVYRVRDGLFVNAALVAGGYAQTLTIPPNVAHADLFRRLAREARQAGRGLWRACTG